jgi:hypothetical protein
METPMPGEPEPMPPTEPEPEPTPPEEPQAGDQALSWPFRKKGQLNARAAPITAVSEMSSTPRDREGNVSASRLVVGLAT